MSLFLPLSIIFLLPTDIISTIIDHDDTTNSKDSFLYIPSNIILILWKVNYWLTFALTWILLPFLQYWFASGYYNLNQKFRYSIIELLKFQLIMIIVGFIFLIYIIINHRDWLNFQFLKSLIITISHIYSLILALFLMSHSLISIPKNQFLNSTNNFNTKLNKNYINLYYLKENLSDAKFELKETCGKILKLNDLINQNNSLIDYRDWIINLNNLIPQEFKSIQHYNNDYDLINSNEINSKFLNKLTIDLKSNFYKYEIINSNYINLIKNSIDLENKISLKNSKKISNYYYFYYIKPILGKFFSILLLILSIIIIESELLHNTRFSIINLIFNNKNLNLSINTIKLFTSNFIILNYMVFCSIISLSQIKIFNIYHLSYNQNSDPVSTIFFISYAARLTIPLSYNYLMLLDSNIIENSSFQKFLGNSIQLIPIGKFLNDLLPRLLLIPILLNLFNVWDYLKKWFNGIFFLDYFFDEFEFNDEEPISHSHESNDQLDIENDGSTIETRRDLLKIKESKKIINQYLKDNNISGNNGITNNSEQLNRFGISDNQLRTLNLTSNHYSDNDTINDNDNSFHSNRVLGDTSNNNEPLSQFPIPTYNSNNNTESVWNRIGNGFSNLFKSRNNNQGGYNGIQFNDSTSLRNLELSSTISNDRSDSIGSIGQLSFDRDNHILRDDEIVLDDDDDERIFL